MAAPTFAPALTAGLGAATSGVSGRERYEAEVKANPGIPRYMHPDFKKYREPGKMYLQVEPFSREGYDRKVKEMNAKGTNISPGRRPIQLPKPPSAPMESGSVRGSGPRNQPSTPSPRSGRPPQSSLNRMDQRKERVSGKLQRGLDRSEDRAAQAITRRKDKLQAKLDAGKIDQGQYDARLGRAEGRIEDRMDRRNAFLTDRMEKVEGFEGNRRDFRNMMNADRRDFRQEVRADRRDAFQEKRQGLVDARKSGDISKGQFKNRMGALKERRQDRMEDRKERRQERREDRKERRMEAKSKAMKKRAARKEMKQNRKGRG